MSKLHTTRQRYFILLRKLSSLQMKHEIEGCNPLLHEEIDECEDELQDVAKELDNLMMFHQETISNTTSTVAIAAYDYVVIHDMRLN